MGSYPSVCLLSLLEKYYFAKIQILIDFVYLCNCFINVHIPMAGKAPEETVLIAALIAGDFAAFEELYKKYGHSLYNFALKLSKNPHEAEELAQSVFVSMWETRQSIDTSQPFGTYLFSIAKNRFYDMLRKRVSESCYVDYILHQDLLLADDLEKQIEDNEVSEIINTLLEKVPERRRNIFRMNREEDMSYKQIAEKLQISENTVDTQIRNVLNFLRKELPKYLNLFLFLT